MTTITSRIRIIQIGEAFVVQIMSALELGLAAYFGSPRWEEVGRHGALEQAKEQVAGYESVANSVTRVLYESEVEVSIDGITGKRPVAKETR